VKPLIDHGPKEFVNFMEVAYFNNKYKNALSVCSFYSINNREILQFHFSRVVGGRDSDGLQCGRPGFDCWQCEFILFSTASRPALGPTQLPIQWLQGIYSPGVKRPVRETDHSCPQSTEVKNTWFISQ
jgi:hypothetical protein